MELAESSHGRRSCGALLLALVVFGGVARQASAVSIDSVFVGHPGNAKDSNGYGSVAYNYRIGTYVVTIEQYASFLNAVAKRDPYHLYNPLMSSTTGDLHVAGINRSGLDGTFSYAVVGPSGQTRQGADSPGSRPITYVSWFDAARFANWMVNGQGEGSTEFGAYTLTNGAFSGTTSLRTPGATYYIPSVNEWYKAAFYSPSLKSGTGGYWLYATESNQPPSNDLDAAGGSGGQANFFTNGYYAVTKSASLLTDQNYLTNVGAFTTSTSHYGTFDQSGNVYQWSDGGGSNQVQLRGGSWSDDDPYYLSADNQYADQAAAEGPYYGFRLAMPVVRSGTSDPYDPYVITINVPTGAKTQAQVDYPILSGTVPVLKIGFGTLVLGTSNSLGASTTVQEGTLLVTHPTALANSIVKPLAGGTVSFDLAGGRQPTIGGPNATIGEIDMKAGGVVDIGRGTLSIFNRSRAEITGAIEAGLLGTGSTGDGAGWTQLTSLAARSDHRRTVGWCTSDNGAILIAYAAPGDTNLDWSIDESDMANLLAGGKFDSGLPGAPTWSEGDFNYDDRFDILDIVSAFSTNLYQQGSYVSLPSQAVVAVPEPSATIIVAILLPSAWALRDTVRQVRRRLEPRSRCP
jgi:sulfatase modifying factor 1